MLNRISLPRLSCAGCHSSTRRVVPAGFEIRSQCSVVQGLQTATEQSLYLGTSHLLATDSFGATPEYKPLIGDWIIDKDESNVLSHKLHVCRQYSFQSCDSESTKMSTAHHSSSPKPRQPLQFCYEPQHGPGLGGVTTYNRQRRLSAGSNSSGQRYSTPPTLLLGS